MTNAADKTTAKAKAEATFDDALLNCTYAPLIKLVLKLAGRTKAAKKPADQRGAAAVFNGTGK